MGEERYMCMRMADGSKASKKPALLDFLGPRDVEMTSPYYASSVYGVPLTQWSHVVNLDDRLQMISVTETSLSESGKLVAMLVAARYPPFQGNLRSQVLHGHLILQTSIEYVERSPNSSAWLMVVPQANQRCGIRGMFNTNATSAL